MAQQVQAPDRQPRVGGIKDVLPDYVLDPRLTLALGTGGVSWEDAGCMLPAETRAGCYDQVTPVEDKYGYGVSKYTSIGAPFAQFGGVECYIGGDSIGESYTQQATELLAAGDDRLIEERLYEWAIADGSIPSTSLVHAIGYIDDLADVNYVGRPVLLMSRRNAAAGVAEGVLVRENGRIFTANGNPVVASGAIENEIIAAVGQPIVWATPVITGSAPNLETNFALAIAERVYGIGVDCNYRVAFALPVGP